MIKEQDYHVIEKIDLYARDLNEPKYKFLIKKGEDAGIKDLDNPNKSIVCSITMDDVYGDIDNHNPKRNKKVLIVFDDMIADIMGNKQFQAILKALFITCRKLNISLAFISFFCSRR